MFTELQLINADEYAHPTALVYFVGDPITDPDDIAAELENGYEIDMTDVRGWKDYAVIIRTTDEHGETRYYLAR